MTKATFALRGRNPDVLTCIANLSNDAVFTPPEFANRMLDTLAEAWAADNGGAAIWTNPDVTFLDPFTKSGVFLREIVKRLTEGLAGEIPDLTDRVDHILTNQVFGIATESLTALLARRSVYCSKYANGPHSVAKSFDTEDGNIWFERTEHTWVGGTERILDTDADGNPVERTANGRCKYCGASQKEYERDESLESHAYAFIHTDNIKARISELFGDDMHFDVIIGNPPYQLDTGGSGRQARPIYNLFVEQAKALEPRFLSMVIQSRWFGGGMGLGGFRATMLGDRRLRRLVDFTDSSEAFPGTDFGGGVCYFLWDRDNPGPCTVTSHVAGRAYESERELDEFEHFIRYAPAVPILKKVLAKGEPSLRSVVSTTRPFGIPTSARPTGFGELRLVSSKGSGLIPSDTVVAGHHLVHKWKVLVSKTSHDHAGLPDKNGQRRVLSRMEPLEPGAVCTESYIVVGGFDTREEATNCITYLSTRFVRFLISILSFSQDITSGRFEYVPIQSFSRPWTDAELYERYDLKDEEIEFVENMIRPIGSDSE